MKTIDNLASLDGRILIHEIYYKLKFERQRNSFSVLITLWRLCTVETDITQYIKKNITIQHKLGLLRGTSLWLEEIVNRYYFSKINSLVYFGAAVLLVLIGLNNFTTLVNNHYVIYGLIFEASMLIFMFFVMLFTPNEDVLTMNNEETNEALQRELIVEIGEISRDFAVTSAQLDKITDKFETIIDKQNTLLILIKNIAESNIEAVKPNPQMLEIMKETNIVLEKFNLEIDELNKTVNKLKINEIESVVKQEIEKFIINKVEKNI